ncbi:MAG: hypothetical protein KDA20_13110, partial [Phycisphaerales bacterium]|nr:hypothetical protein [Phycisphaerales bacterium]
PPRERKRPPPLDLGRVRPRRRLAVGVRVPVERAHRLSITVELATSSGRNAIEEVLRSAPGILYWPADRRRHPTPLSASGRNDILVGRLREASAGDGRCWSLWVCGDQLRKGEALNVVQIMELCRRAPLRAQVPPEGLEPSTR